MTNIFDTNCLYEGSYLPHIVNRIILILHETFTQKSSSLRNLNQIIITAVYRRTTCNISLRSKYNFLRSVDTLLSSFIFWTPLIPESFSKIHSKYKFKTKDIIAIYYINHCNNLHGAKLSKQFLILVTKALMLLIRWKIHI